MEKGLKRNNLITLIICLLFFVSKGEAHLSDLARGNFEVSGEALLMLSSASQPYYAFSSSNGYSTLGKRAANDQSWHWGYRIEAGYTFCNCLNDITLRWTRFPNFLESDTLEGNPYILPVFNAGNTAPFNREGTATIRDEYSPFLIDLLFGHTVIDSCSFRLTLQGGFQYGYLSFKENFSAPASSGSTIFIDARSRMKGVGPELGIEASYDFWSCFDFRARLNNGWLVGEITKTFEGINSGTGLLAKSDNDRYWRLFPTTDVRFGLGYSGQGLNFRNLGCGRCLKIDLEIGYELIAFRKGLERILFVDQGNEGSSFNEELTFTLTGPYFHAGIRF